MLILDYFFFKTFCLLCELSSDSSLLLTSSTMIIDLTLKEQKKPKEIIIIAMTYIPLYTLDGPFSKEINVFIANLTFCI